MSFEPQFTTIVSNQFSDRIKLVKSYCKESKQYLYELFNLTNNTYFAKLELTNYIIQMPIYIMELRYIDSGYKFSEAQIYSSNGDIIITIRRTIDNLNDLIEERQQLGDFMDLSFEDFLKTKKTNSKKYEVYDERISNIDRILEEFAIYDCCPASE